MTHISDGGDAVPPLGGSPSSMTHIPDGGDAVPPVGGSSSSMTGLSDGGDAMPPVGGSSSSMTGLSDGGDAVPPCMGGWNADFLRRKHPARGVVASWNQPTLVFLTVCTKDRQPWLAQVYVHEALRKVWTQANAWVVGRYVIMPDHIHLFCAPNDPNVSLNLWVGYWKRQFSCLHLPGVAGWQRDCWDTRLRRTENYAAKWEYVRHNPVRAGLCGRAEDWPFQGELWVLEW